MESAPNHDNNDCQPHGIRIHRIRTKLMEPIFDHIAMSTASIDDCSTAINILLFQSTRHFANSARAVAEIIKNEALTERDATCE